MKRIISLLLALTILTLSSCLSDSTDVNDTTSGINAAAETTADINAAKYLGTDIAVASENYKVTLAMAAFMYNTYIYSNGNYLVNNCGVDLSTSLKRQYTESGESWFDYCLNITKGAITEMISFCEAANEAGYTLTDEDILIIDENMESIENEAAANDMTAEKYVKNHYGDIVTIDAVEEYYRLSVIADVYSSKIYNENEVTEEDIKVEYDKNSKYYQYADVLTISVGTEDMAKKLSSFTTEAEFKNAATGEREAVYTYTEGNAVSEWIWSAERQAGEVYYTFNTAGSYTVVYLTKLPYRSEVATYNFRGVLLTTATYDDVANAAASLIKGWQEGGGDEDEFSEAATAYNEDINAGTGGLYQGVASGEFGLTEIDEWIVGERAYGDYETFKADSGDYYVLYFIGEDMVKWMYDIKRDMESTAYNKVKTEYTEKYGVGITFDYNILFEIPA